MLSSWDKDEYKNTSIEDGNIGFRRAKAEADITQICVHESYGPRGILLITSLVRERTFLRLIAL